MEISNYRLLTFAKHYIFRDIFRYIIKNSTISSYKWNKIEYLWAIKKEIQRLQVKGEEITAENLAKTINIPVYKLEKFLVLNSEIPDKDASICTVDDTESKVEAANTVAVLLKDLPKREREYIRKNFGIGCDEKTYESIGKEYGITKQRVEQIINRGLNMLRKKKNLQMIMA